jgi:polyhydroxybutyrate depolymerase
VELDGRTFELHVGAGGGGDPSAARPLVLAFHGGSADGTAMRKLTNLDARADRAGWVVAYPNGVDGHWNDGRGVENYPAHRDDVDDIGFVARLVEHLEETAGVDRRRVYATGFSNGGMFVHRLAMARPDLLAAVAPVAGTIARPLLEPGPTAAVPVFMIHGTADRMVPYDGGPVGGPSESRGEVASVSETAERWRSANRCSGQPEEETLPHRDDADPTRVGVATWRPAEGEGDGAEVVVATVVEGGHTWPGGLQYRPQRFIGPTARDLIASDAIVEFFSRHAR